MGGDGDGSEHRGGIELDRLKTIVDRLREPDGCLWDLEQTAVSLLPYLLEEAHEVAEAVRSEHSNQVRDELGDLLLNIFLQVRIAEENGQFDLAQVAECAAAKIIRRHPHVFGDQQGADLETIRRNWRTIKAKERGSAITEAPSALRVLPTSLSALIRGQRLGEDAAAVGFDWRDRLGPLAKVREELAEVEEALDGADPVRVEEEIGDLLFAVTSLCRHQSVDAESALSRALDRFRTRFQRVEAGNQDLRQLDTAGLERLWQAAKHSEESS